jgi:HK97 family phage major capsid protein
MKSKEIREKIGELTERLVALDDTVTKENRSMTAEETTQFEKDLAERDALKVELERQLKLEAIRAEQAAAKVAGSGVQIENKEDREVAKAFTFGDAVRAAFSGKMDGVVREMHQEGEMEMARVGQSSNGIVIPSKILNRAAITVNNTTGIEEGSFVQGVYAQTILGDLGVTRLSTSTDQRIPIIPSVTTQWEGETDNAADGGSAMTKVDLQPIRLATYLDYSKQAAMQHNQSLEAALQSAIQQAVAAKLEYAIFTDDTANGAFEWLGNGKTPVTNAAITALILATMEEVIGNNHNFGNLGFAISHDLFSEIHTAAQVSGVNPLLMNNMIMGLTARFSTQIADITNPALYYGDWSKLYVAQFGGLEILVDPYTQAVGGKNRLVLNSYWDAALVQDAAISVGTFG